MRQVVSGHTKAAGKSAGLFRSKKPLLDYLPKAWRYTLLGLSISCAVYLAARYALDQGMMQEQRQQVQQHEPKTGGMA